MTPWFKFYGGEYLYDPKIISLTAPQRSCWISLLCYASVSEIPGEIKYLTEEKLLIASGIDPVDDLWTETQGVLQKFKGLEMIALDDNGMITVKNFRKRQDSALTSYERVRKFREKKRNETDETTPFKNDNSRVDKRREEYPPYPPRGKTAKADWGRRNYDKPDYRESPKKTAAETKAELERLKNS
jgi:hypothetical protein